VVSTDLRELTLGALFVLRFDLRNPAHAQTAMADRYDAVLEMAEWADRLGCVSLVLSEHHGAEDGYLPSPLPMAAAIAARTTDVRINIAALLAPFYDPVRLAEDLLVIDHLSRGRVDLILALGYVRQEFELYGIDRRDRVRRLTEVVEVLHGAFRGEPFEVDGRTIQITPGPYREHGIRLTLGGSSEPAARRAARLGTAFLPSVPEVWDHYREESIALGRPDPGPCTIPEDNRIVALAEDPDEGWAQMAPFFLHEMNAYGAWWEQEQIGSPYRPVATADELRATGKYAVLTPEQYVEELRAMPFPLAFLHPMCGGMPIDLAWSSLRLFEERVLPVV
jgi:alkanesulfonate monooxygenase SsuD/methylene tetrahydromethanopterin reductase-like flavin-dependent oxidoreductase (luciferase family)